MENNETEETLKNIHKEMYRKDYEEVSMGDKLTLMFARLGFLTGLLVLSLFVFNGDIFNIDKKDAVATPIQAITPVSPFKELLVEAKAAYVFDLESEKILYSKNEHSQLPLASLTKLMTALVASELISEDTIITIEEESIAINGDNGFHTDEKWNFKDLLDYTLVVSSNDGAHAIASAAGAFVQEEDNFIDKMNQTAVSLGLAQTYFINESGLDASPLVGGGYGSARDTASLLAYIISSRPQLLEATGYETLSFVSEDQFIYNATNTNSVAGNIPNLVASKTGFTELAGGNLAIVFDAGINHPVVAVVLGSSFEGRFNDIEKLVKASLEEIAL